MTDSALVLTQAVSKAGQFLGLNHQQILRALGCDQTDLIEAIDPQSNQGRHALVLIRIFQALDALMGADLTAIQGWMRSRNNNLQGIPIELILNDKGQRQVLEYLEAQFTL